MIPFIEIEFQGIEWRLATSSLLFLMSLLACMLIVARPLASTIGWVRSTFLVLVTAASGLLGGRLLHVIWERPQYFLQNPQLAFTNFDGLVFYGAFAAAILTFYCLARWLLKSERQLSRAWDLAAIGAATCIGILRLACFAEGCCWGSPTSFPWAVRFFNEQSVMPWLGIPVHPVQIYESLLGFILAVGLALIYRAQLLQGQLLFVLFLGYGSGRWILEMFRGDSFRGVNLLFGMSTSQIISLAFILIAAHRLSAQLRPRSVRSLS